MKFQRKVGLKMGFETHQCSWQGVSIQSLGQSPGVPHRVRRRSQLDPMRQKQEENQEDKGTGILKSKGSPPAKKKMPMGWNCGSDSEHSNFRKS